MPFFSFHHHPGRWASLYSQVYAKGTQMFFDPKSTYILPALHDPFDKIVQILTTARCHIWWHLSLWLPFFPFPSFVEMRLSTIQTSKHSQGCLRTWNQLCTHKWSQFWTFPKSTWRNENCLGLLWNSDQEGENALTLWPSPNPCLRSGCTLSGSLIIFI